MYVTNLPVLHKMFSFVLPDLDALFYEDRLLLVVGMIGMIHPNGDEFHPKALCHWDEIHPNGWRLLAPLG